jgi:hypothetical protein
MRFASFQVKTPASRSSALLSFVTRLDQVRVGRRAGLWPLVFRCGVFGRAAVRAMGIFLSLLPEKNIA